MLAELGLFPAVGDTPPLVSLLAPDPAATTIFKPGIGTKLTVQVMVAPTAASGRLLHPVTTEPGRLLTLKIVQVMAAAATGP